jgi:hypothetical protein
VLLGEGQVVALGPADGEEPGVALDALSICITALLLGQIGQVECGQGENEIEDEGVLQTYLWDIAYPKFVHVGVVVAGKGLSRGGDEVEEQLGIVKVDLRRVGMHG